MKYGGFDHCVVALGYRDESEFRRALARDFESYKVRWETESGRTIMMQGRALQDPAAAPITVIIQITKFVSRLPRSLSSIIHSGADRQQSSDPKLV